VVHFTDLGAITQLLALVFAAYAIAATIAGVKTDRAALLISARRAVYLVAGLMLLTSVSLLASFVIHDFGAAYVYQHSSLAMPWYYTTTAFYSGQEGSLLYWATTLAVFAALAVVTARQGAGVLGPIVGAVLMGIEGFLLFVLNFISSPFNRIAIAPIDGLGLNPLLQDPGMIVHPPMLLLGYMSFSVPFAFAVAALITGQLDAGWLRDIRRWMLAAWGIQTIGLLLGMWWAYHVLGWGGYWGWDPVENAALLPWLTASAFLHSSMVQERRGALKVWNLALVLITFALCVFGTFEVRSGLISSVHSFAYSAVGSAYLIFLTVVILGACALFAYRLPRLRPDQEFESVVSREGSFLLNNFVLTGITFATLWGTLFPLLSQAAEGKQQTVGAVFYEQVNGPLFAVLIFLMGAGPLLAWRRASWRAFWRHVRWPLLIGLVTAGVLPLLGARNLWADLGFALCAFTAGTVGYEFWRGVRVRHRHGEGYAQALIMLVDRHRRRYGGYVVHLGLILLAVGAIGSHFFQVTREATLRPGQSVTTAGYVLTYNGVSDTTENSVEMIRGHFTLVTPQGQRREVAAGQRIFPNFPDQPTSLISITTSALTDLYVFVSVFNDDGSVGIRVFANPLVPLVWLGGSLMLLGGLLCWWPERRRIVAPSATSGLPEREAVPA
jgi:cytochrome c-type biogenesis protein CcmF